MSRSLIRSWLCWSFPSTTTILELYEPERRGLESPEKSAGRTYTNEIRTHRYRKMLSASWADTRPAGSFPQHFAKILHKFVANACFFFPSGLPGRSPSRTLDLTSVSSISSHKRFPMNIWMRSVMIIQSEDRESVPRQQ